MAAPIVEEVIGRLLQKLHGKDGCEQVPDYFVDLIKQAVCERQSRDTDT